MLKHCVTADEENSRADKIVRMVCTNLGFGLLQKLFRKGRIKINGEKTAPSDRVKQGDIVIIHADINENAPARNFNAENFEKLRSLIIFENDDFFAINKPAKLAVQGGTKIKFCVDNLIKSYADFDCRLVHRLDKETSGALLIAKNRKSSQYLTELFRENKIKKKYLAIVDGKIKKSGTIKNFLTKSFCSGEEKIVVAQNFDDGKEAITHYNPLKSLDKNRTVLELRPFTGRKHQLRVHCADCLNAPIIGDKKYGNLVEKCKECNDFLFLHCHELSVDGINIVADLPEHFCKILRCKSLGELNEK